MNARRIASAPVRGAKALARMVFPRYGGIARWVLPRTRFNFAREVGDGLGSSVIVAPILWMARTFPEAPLQVVDEDAAPVDQHPMVNKVRRPNQYYSGIVMWMATLMSWVIDGNAYWLKVRDGVDGVAELYYVPHWMIEPKSDDDSSLVTHYEYRPDGRPVRLENDDVVHFRYGLNPDDTRKGLSPLASVLREVFTDDEAANFSAALLRNMGIPGVLISPDGDDPPTPDDVKAVKAYVDEEFGGENRGKPLVMSGRTKVEQFGFSPEQLNLKALRRIPEERVAAVLGIPAIIAGFGAGLDRSTFSNYSEAREAAYEDNIIPTQRLFGEDLWHQLLPDFDDQPELREVTWDRSKVRVLQDDRSKEATRLAELVRAGIFTRARALEKLGEEATPADDVYLLPLSVTAVPAGELPAPPQQLALPAPADEGKRRGRKQATRAQTGLIVMLDRDASHLENLLAGGLQADFDVLGEQVAAAFEALGVSPDALASRNGHTKASDEVLADQVVATAGVTAWTDGTLRTRLEDHYRRTSDLTVDTINTALDLGVELPDPVENQIVMAGGTRRGLLDITGETRAAIQRAIADARAAGQGPEAVGRLIREYVPEGRFVNAGSAYRAQLVARAETKTAQNMSSLAAYRESDTVTAVLCFDARVGSDHAPECISRAGQEFTFDDAAGEDLTHPNCSLSWAPVVGSTADSTLVGALQGDAE